MKRCPACGRVYDDDELQFCLEDGTRLVNPLAAESAPPTLVLPESQPSAPTLKATTPLYVPRPADSGQDAWVATPRRKSNPLVMVGVVILLVIMGAGALVGGLVIYKKRAPLPWHLVLAVDPATPDRSAAAKQVATVIESRLSAVGLPNFRVSPLDNGQIQVDLPSYANPERIKSLISTMGKLELTHVISPANPSPLQTYPTREAAIASLNNGGNIPTNRRVLVYRDSAARTPEKWVVVEAPAIVAGTDIRTAAAEPTDTHGEDYQVTFSLNRSGADHFGAWTGANINQYLGIVLNDEVKSAPLIRSQISDQGAIEGGFDKQAAEDLALILKSGPLPAKVQFLEERIDR